MLDLLRFLLELWCNLTLCFVYSTAMIPARYILAVLGSIAMAIIYGLKVNLSVAIVAMVNQSGHARTENDSLPGECPADKPDNSSSKSMVRRSKNESFQVVITRAPNDRTIRYI